MATKEGKFYSLCVAAGFSLPVLGPLSVVKLKIEATFTGDVEIKSDNGQFTKTMEANQRRALTASNGYQKGDAGDGGDGAPCQIDNGDCDEGLKCMARMESNQDPICVRKRKVAVNGGFSIDGESIVLCYSFTSACP